MKTYLKFLSICILVSSITSVKLFKNDILAKRRKRKAITVSATLVKVSDGDTITVLIKGEKERIRFSGIDAPEKKQKFGQEARKYLKSILKYNLKIKYKKRDRYHRLVGEVFSNGKSTNKEMLKAGFAWFYKRYSKRKELEKLEEGARKKKVGLWVQENPAPPWFYRKYRKVKFILPENFTARVAYVPALKTLGIIYNNRSFFLRLTNIKCSRYLDRKLQRRLYEKIVFKKVKVVLTKKHKFGSNKIMGRASIKKINLIDFYSENTNCKIMNE